MKIEDIEKEWSKDSQIDSSSLDTESLKIPSLHNKYYKIFIKEKIHYKKMECEYDEFLQTKKDYYNGKLSQEELKEYNWKQCNEIIIKNELPGILDADNDLNEKKLKLSLQSEKIDFLKSILYRLNNRSYTIKNAIEFLKFVNGVN